MQNGIIEIANTSLIYALCAIVLLQIESTIMLTVWMSYTEIIVNLHV